MDPKYPDITVPLSGMDGNAMVIISKASRIARHGGLTAHEIADFQKQATSGDYDNVLQTVMEWFDTE